jgi:OPA family sugar phosphate sensor protein UhpC-like MFS transporter
MMARRCHDPLSVADATLYVELHLDPRYERWRWRTFGITWLVYAAYYFTRQSSTFSVAKVAFASDPRIKLTRGELGWIDAASLTTYMIGQFLFGPLGDRFGPRRILVAGMAASIVAAVASGFATAFVAFFAFALVQGLAQSTGWSNVNKAMSSWFSLRERGRVVGWWCTHYTVGAAAAAWFAGWMMMRFGRVSPAVESAEVIPFWPAAFWGPAVVLAAVMCLTWWLLRDRPEDVGLPPIEEYHGEPMSPRTDETITPLPQDGSWQIIWEVLARPTIWVLAFAYFSIKFARYAFLCWGPMYLSESIGASAATSTISTIAMSIGGALGVISTGYLSDRFFQSRRAPVAVLSLLATAGITFLGLSPVREIWFMWTFFFLVGAFLFGPDSLISSTASMDFGTKRGAGTATGFINGIGSCGGILGGYLPGKITTETNWAPVFNLMLIGLIASAAILMTLWWKRPPSA